MNLQNRQKDLVQAIGVHWFIRNDRDLSLHPRVDDKVPASLFRHRRNERLDISVL